MFSKEELYDFNSNLFAGCFVGALFTPIGVVCWQLFLYLKNGNWRPFSALDVLRICGIADRWVVYPENWIGLHEILNWLHGGIFISLVFIAISIGLILLIQATE